MLRPPFSVAALSRTTLGDSIAAMKRLVLLPITALAACNSSTGGADPGAVTQEEAEALEDAASMLDEQRLPDETPENQMPQGEPE